MHSVNAHAVDEIGRETMRFRCRSFASVLALQNYDRAVIMSGYLGANVAGRPKIRYRALSDRAFRIVFWAALASDGGLHEQEKIALLTLVARGDRDHDIAAWFGVNQGRIAEVKDGSKFGIVAAAPARDLPPKGPPGIKGRRLRKDAKKALDALEAGDTRKARTLLEEGTAEYDQNER